MTDRTKICILSELLVPERGSDMRLTSHCPAPAFLIALDEGTLDEASARQVREHLSGCESCGDLRLRLHAFSQSPIATDRGDVAWARTQQRLDRAIRGALNQDHSVHPQVAQRSEWAAFPAPAKWTLGCCTAMLVAGVLLLVPRGPSQSVVKGLPLFADDRYRAPLPVGSAGEVGIPNATGSAPGTAPAVSTRDLVSADPDSHSVPSLTSDGTSSGSVRATTDHFELLPSVAVRMTIDTVTEKENGKFQIAGTLMQVGGGFARAMFSALVAGSDQSATIRVDRIISGDRSFPITPPRTLMVNFATPADVGLLQPGGSIMVRAATAFVIRLPN